MQCGLGRNNAVRNLPLLAQTPFLLGAVERVGPGSLPPRYGDTRGHSAAQLPRLPVSIPVVPAATAWVLTLPGPFSQQALLLAFLPESGTAWGTFEVSLFILTIKYYAEFTLSSCLVCLVALHAPPTACCPNGRPLVLKPQKP